MFKKILIVLTILLIGLGIAGYQVYQYPKKMYYSWVQGKEFNDWYNVRSFHQDIFNNQTVSIDRSFAQVDTDSLWRNFHVMDLLVPLPVKHPVYTVIPILKFEGSNLPPQIGFEFLTVGNRRLANLIFLPKGNFKLKDSNQKLFQIPFFRRSLEHVALNKIWRDVFEMKFNGLVPNSISDMIYHLFLINQRSEFLPRSIKTFGYLEKLDLAIVEYPSKNKDFKTELIMSQMGGIVRSYLLTTRLGDHDAKILRNRLLKDVKSQQDSEDTARLIYEEFKSLEFRDQVSELGMIHLFSAWSHWTENKDFLRVMIQFLERGKDNLHYLRPLYAYAYSKYGTSFSKIDQQLKEKAEEEFKRKLEEERQKEIKEAMDKAVQDIDLSKLSPEERINYRLKKAKENKSKTPDDKVLVVD